MKGTWVVVLVVLLAVSIGINLGLGVSVLVQKARLGERPAAGPPPVAREALGRLVDQLGLEGEAREQFIAAQRRFFESTQADRRLLERQRRELRREVAQPVPDRARIEALLEQSNAAAGRLERAFVDHVLATRQQLSPEQQRLFLEWLPRLRAARERAAAGAGFRSLRERFDRPPSPAGAPPPEP